MKITVWHRLDFFARNLTPILITVIFVLISVTPTRLPGATYIMPALAPMAVYYWSLHRADLLPATAVFAIGLLQDVLSGAPMGLNTVVLLAIFGVCVTQRQFFYGKSFLVVWFGFISINAAALVLSWLLVLAVSESIVNPRPAIFEYLAAVMFYPPVAWLFSQMHRVLPRRE